MPASTPSPSLLRFEIWHFGLLAPASSAIVKMLSPPPKPLAESGALELCRSGGGGGRLGICSFWKTDIFNCVGANAFIMKLLLCHHPESNAASCEFGVRVLASSHEEESACQGSHPRSTIRHRSGLVLNAPSLNHLPRADAKNHGKTWFVTDRSLVVFPKVKSSRRVRKEQESPALKLPETRLPTFSFSSRHPQTQWAPWIRRCANPGQSVWHSDQSRVRHKCCRPQTWKCPSHTACGWWAQPTAACTVTTACSAEAHSWPQGGRLSPVRAVLPTITGEHPLFQSWSWLTSDTPNDKLILQPTSAQKEVNAKIL